MTYHDKHLCKHCLHAFEQHGPSTNKLGKPFACPQGNARFPKYPHAYAKKHGEIKAGELWDHRITRYWGVLGTTFSPV